MSRRYQLDIKIEALNLLDQHDGDFHLVEDLLGIPGKTLENWRAAEDDLRKTYDDRQYRHFANIKLELLKDMFESCRELMKTIKADSHKDSPISQRAYTLTTLLNHASKLEDLFEELDTDAQNEEQANRIEYVRDDKAQAASRRAASNPRPLQGVGARAALRQIGIGQNRKPESGPTGTEALMAERAQLPDGAGNLARLGKKRKKTRRHRNKRNRKPH
jgi:uncharacterized protein YigA (DUF484 family)